VSPAKAPKRRERDIQSAILALLHARGVVAWKAGAGAFRVGDRYVKMGHRGVADIIGVLPPAGRLLAVEVKRSGATPTGEQHAFLFSVRQAGGLAFVAHSTDDVAKELGWT
jgi:hypothetical protein